jgi:hypothetical protein
LGYASICTWESQRFSGRMPVSETVGQRVSTAAPNQPTTQLFNWGVSRSAGNNWKDRWWTTNTSTSILYRSNRGSSQLDYKCWGGGSLQQCNECTKYASRNHDTLHARFIVVVEQAPTEVYGSPVASRGPCSQY